MGSTKNGHAGKKGGNKGSAAQLGMRFDLDELRKN